MSKARVFILLFSFLTIYGLSLYNMSAFGGQPDAGITIKIIGDVNKKASQRLYQDAIQYKSTDVSVVKVNDKSQATAMAFVCGKNNCSLPIKDSKEIPAILKDIKSKESLANTKKTLTNMDKYVKQSTIRNWFANNNIVAIAGGFWFLGILLAFTPCILPLIILIVGFLGGRTQEITYRKTILLSIVYVLSLALTYAVAGVVTAMTGIYLQAYFQNVWVISAFSIIIAFFAFSLLDFYKIQLPSFMRHYAASHIRYQPQYHYIEVMIMGVFATLIAAPCVAAPMVAVLGYVGSAGDILLGALAMFFIGVGIGTPIVITACFNRQILPKAGQWQHVLKGFLGIVLLGIAVWTASRIIPHTWNMLIWSILIIFTGNYMHSMLLKHHVSSFYVLWKTLSIIVVLYGIAIFAGYMLGSRNPFNPLNLGYDVIKHENIFRSIPNTSEFNAALAEAKIRHQPVMVLFSADWCESCIELENDVFENSRIREELKSMSLLKVDLTGLNSPAYLIASQFHVTSPPVVVFYNSDGDLLREQVVGLISINKFHEVLTKMRK